MLPNLLRYFQTKLIFKKLKINSLKAYKYNNHQKSSSITYNGSSAFFHTSYQGEYVSKQ